MKDMKDPIQQLKSKIIRLKISDTIAMKKPASLELYKEQFIKDAKKVRETFTDEDLQSQFNSY